jgi:hypothetical protein
LLSAGAAVFYVAKGEGAAQRTPAVVNGAAAAVPVVPVEPVAVVAIDAGVAEAVTVADASTEMVAVTAGDAGMSADLAVDAGSTAVTHPKKPVVVKPKTPRRTGPARNLKEARRLISEARGHVGRTEFEEAKAKYRRVVKSRFLNQMGYLGLSDVAFQEKDGTLAIKYAKKAGNSIKARMALGNAYFKQGDFRQSLKIFNGVLAKNPSHKEAQSHAKAARLKLGK